MRAYTKFEEDRKTRSNACRLLVISHCIILLITLIFIEKSRSFIPGWFLLTVRNILQNERAAPLWVCQENVCPLLAFCTHAPCAASWQFFTAIAETHIMLLQIPDYPRHIMLYLWVMVLLKHWLMYFYRSTLWGEAAPSPYIYQNVDSISLFAESVTFPRSQRLKAFLPTIWCPRLSIDFLGRFCSL